MADYYIELDERTHKRVYAKSLDDARIKAVDLLHKDRIRTPLHTFLARYRISTYRTAGVRKGAVIFNTPTGTTPVGVVYALDDYYWLPRSALEQGHMYHWRIYSDGSTDQRRGY